MGYLTESGVTKPAPEHLIKLQGKSMSELETRKQFALGRMRQHQRRMVSGVNLTPDEIKETQNKVQTLQAFLSAIRAMKAELVEQNLAGASGSDNAATAHVKEQGQAASSAAQAPATTNPPADAVSIAAQIAVTPGKDKNASRELNLSQLPTEDNYTHMQLDHIAENVLVALGRHHTKEPLNHSFIPLGVAGFITKRMNLKRLPERMDWDSYDPPARPNPQQLHQEADESVSNREIVQILSSPESLTQQFGQAQKFVQATSDTYDGEPMEGVEIAGVAEKGIGLSQDSEGVAYPRTLEPEQMAVDVPTEAPETSVVPDMAASEKMRDGGVRQLDKEESANANDEEESGFTALNKQPQSLAEPSLPANSESSVTLQICKEPNQTSHAAPPVINNRDSRILESLVAEQPPSVAIQATSVEIASSSRKGMLIAPATPPKTSSDVVVTTSATRVLDDSSAQAPLIKELGGSDEVDKASSHSPEMVVVRLPTPITRPTELATPLGQRDLSTPTTVSFQRSPVLTPAKLALTNDRRRRHVKRFVTRSEPHYSIYNCGWHCIRAGKQDICAQLHNITALKRHVFMKHRNGSDFQGYKCLWEKCHNDNKLNYQFDSLAEFDKHILEKHIKPIEAGLGSGPSVAEELEKWPETLVRITNSLLTPLAIPMSDEMANARKKQLAQETANVPAKLPRQLREAIKDLKTYGAGWALQEDGQVDTEPPSRQDGEADEEANKLKGNLGLYYSYEL
ncbi:uncharacterized protein V1513DRAFT_454272 [Lipomyces chichibuensis]|uniref:uncharacterized protein n=1 Tax=Lipomyces chichibuensis TaxID=1546026 RepID=UPI003343223B